MAVTFGKYAFSERCEFLKAGVDKRNDIVRIAEGRFTKRDDDGFFHDDLQFKGETWEFKLDGDWRFVGVVGSVVSRKMYPEYDLEANADYFGKPVYYNEKLDRVAILVEDDNFAYSDIVWEIRVRSRITETE